ncbi:MAG: methyl-accepting chemotaxis protein [Ectothiorhodospiraceae bacterium]|jgi:aerotaxis receptor|nr:methyl-accepting chemotaxis protein [Ectothiorhodospiraceae bacterium]
MRKNLPITKTEQSFRDDEIIVSITDPKGLITYANDAFIRISGFTQEELIGKPHNLVRHPDMPPAAFQDLWDTLRAGKSWMGLVKNRCKNGDYYWVDAYASPLYDGNTLIGYQSVRIKPERQHVERAEKLYTQISDGKRPHLYARIDPRNWSWFGRIYGTLAGYSTIGMLGLHFWFSLPLFASLALYAGALLANLPVAWVMTSGLRHNARRARQIHDSPLMQMVYTGRMDESGAIELAHRYIDGGQRTQLGVMESCGKSQREAIARMVQAAEQTRSGTERQQAELHQVATAMNEMTTSVHDVARNTSQAASAAQGAADAAGKGQHIIGEAIDAIRSLADEVRSAAEVIHRLRADTSDIDSVLEIIGNVAEQTNMLALNAAIEAARAGEHGRGFAVVADEVRTLASRTQASTQDIHERIERLQAAAAQAVAVMDRALDKATRSVDETGRAGAALEEIAAAIGIITDMNVQVATAAEEQAAVAEEIDRNISNLAHAGEHLSLMVHDTSGIVVTLEKISSELTNLVDRAIGRGTNRTAAATAA